MHGFIHDARSAARALVRAPGFVLVALATLGAAIAVNAAMFAFLNAAFFRPLPYAEPAQLHDLRVAPISGEGPFEAPRVDEVRRVLSGLATVAAYQERSFVVAAEPVAGERAAPAVVQGARAEANLAQVIGVAPVVGRAFEPGDDIAGAPAVVIITDAFRRRHLAGTDNALGAMIRIDAVDHTIIGVLPPRFAFPDFAGFWVPMQQADVALGEARALVRLASGTPSQAEQAVAQALSGDGSEARVRLVSIMPRGGALLVAMLGAIGFVLLIACSNVANLVLARGTARRHEMGVRVALGASRIVLLRYLAIEGALLAGVAAAIGALASTWLIDLIVAAIPPDGLPLWFDPRIDATVLAYIAGTAMVATLVSAALPGLTVTRGALAATLNEAGARSAGDRAAARMRSGLVAAQIALATVLLAGAGLLLRALAAQNSLDPGYDADAVVEIATLRPMAPEGDRFADEAIARLGAMPGIDAVAAAAPIMVPGRATSPASPSAALGVTGEAVSAAWFETMTLPLLAGRAPGPEETDAIVVSALVARTLFASAADAVGSTIRFENDAPDRTRTIVGVAGNRFVPRPGDLEGGTPVAHVYVPLGAGDAKATRFLLRVASGDPLRFAPAASALLRELESEAVLRTPVRLGDAERLQAGDLRFFSRLFASFGAVAIALAALGCWGVIAYSVTRKRREIGVRIALGASRGRVVREMAASLAMPLGIGLGLGIGGALVLGRLLGSVLFAVAPMDPATLIAVALTFATIASLAAWLPARRAARIDPMHALRAD